MVERPASVGELLAAAQRQAWDLVVSLPAESARAVPGLPPRPARERWYAAARHGREHVVAWPGLALAAGHALRGVPLSPADRQATGPLEAALASLSQTQRPAVLAEVGPSAGLGRLQVLLGAAGDLMAETAWQMDDGAARDAAAVRDKIAAVLQTAATTSTGYLELTPGATPVGGGWDTRLRVVADTARQVRVTAPADRAGRYDDLATPAAAPGGRHEVFAAWEASSRSALSQRFVMSADLQVTAGDLAVVAQVATLTFRAAGQAGLVDPAVAQRAAEASQQAGVAMAQLHGALRQVTTGPGVDRDHLQASRQLRGVLIETVRVFGTPDGSDGLFQPAGRADLAELLADARLLLRRGEGVAAVLASSVTTTARGAGFLLPARVALRSVRPAPTSWLASASRSGWVAVPAAAPQVRAVVEAVEQVRAQTSAAATAAGSARELQPDPVGSVPGPRSATTPVDVEAVAARAASAAGFPTGRGRVSPSPLGIPPVPETDRPPSLDRSL